MRFMRYKKFKSGKIISTFTNICEHLKEAQNEVFKVI